MVTINGKLGFIDNEGKEVVKPIYDKIGFFDVYKTEWALVEINGKVGFIDNKGNYIEKK
ncbi:MAG: WG repeat-containing protein [Bacteroidales bacterium]|nr:WG repeat-containing protein [Bacteroidales bacterium]